MARQRNRQRHAAEAAEAKLDAEIDALRKTGRAWIIRALLAVLIGSLLGLVLPPFFALGTIVALGCIGLGLREGIRAQRLDNARP